MADSISSRLVPGVQVRVTQQITLRDRARSTVIEGIVEEYTQRTTGSWFAHSRSDRLWLDRLRIRRPDGEILILNLDQNSRIEIVETANR